MCSLLLSLLHPKDVLRHARSFISPRWQVEADIYSVCVVDTVVVVGEVVEELSCGDLIVVCVGLFELDDPRLLHDR